MSIERLRRAPNKALDKTLKFIIYFILVSMGQCPRLSLRETLLMGIIKESNQATVSLTSGF